jgi:NitT/TauT family transport system permease protein
VDDLSTFELPAPRPSVRARFKPGVPWKAIRVSAFYVGLLLTWKLVVMAEIWPEYTFPAPEDVFEDLKLAAQDGILWEAIAESMRRMAVGYSMSIVIGLAVGIAMGTWRYIDETLGSLVLGLQSLPSVTWFPLAVLWFGLNERAVIFVVLMGSVCSVAISSATGVKSIPPLLLRAASMFGGPWWQRLFYVILPAMLPSMVQGLKLGWSFAWRSLLAAELLFHTISLGQLLTTGRDLNDVSLVIAIMLVIVVLGMAMDRIVFGRLEGWVNERWGLRAA